MSPQSSLHTYPGSGRTRGPAALLARVLFVGYVAVLAALIIYVTAKGPQLRAALDLEIAQQIAGEDREFCQKLGKEFGTSEFSACAAGLADIRARHKDRVLRDLSPIL